MKNIPAEPILSDFRCCELVKPHWGDMDAFQHVNNVHFFRYFESGRVKYFDDLSLPTMITETGLGPILAAINCNYRQPVLHPDTLEVWVRCKHIGQRSFTMEQLVISQKLRATVAYGDAVIVMFDYGKQEKAAVPDALRSAIAQYEGKTF